jgi:hypothetical protein
MLTELSCALPPGATVKTDRSVGIQAGDDIRIDGRTLRIASVNLIKWPPAHAETTSD